MSASPTLGTLLRHLIEHLDGSVERCYKSAGFTYKPRYTPIVRALMDLEKASLREISQHAHVTHSAVSQTVAQMRRAGLVVSASGIDARERVSIYCTAQKTNASPSRGRLRRSDAS